MERQLALIEEPDQEWRLDERTRELGRRGVAAAREALQAAHRSIRDDERGSRAA